MTDYKAPVVTPLGSDANSDPNDPAQIKKIEADIDQTRNAISGDLRTLGERLSPEHLKEEAREVMNEAKNAAKETLNEAKNVATSTFREVKEDALETVNAKVDQFRDNVRSVERDAVSFVRDNAIPLALMGVGLAWFVSNRRSREERWEGSYAPRDDGRWRYPETGGSHVMDNARDGLHRASATTRDVGYRARDRARGWVEGATQEVSGVADQVRNFAGREAEQVRGIARDTRERIGQATYRARDVAGREWQQARDFSRRATEDHPLAVAAGAVAAGIAIGLLIPETNRERELLGPAREQLLGEAQGLVGDAKEALNGLTHTAKETARDVKTSIGNALG